MIGLKRGTVRLVPYRAEWKRLFEEEAEALREVLGDLAPRTEHVGSTAIEGMTAKPLIDILIAVESLERARNYAPVLEKLGYDFRGDGGVKSRLFFAKGPESRRTHYLSLTEKGSVHWERSIVFRDHLQTHPEAAEDYRKLKQALAEKYPEDREAYTKAKDEFVELMLKQAKFGAASGYKEREQNGSGKENT